MVSAGAVLVGLASSAATMAFWSRNFTLLTLLCLARRR